MQQLLWHEPASYRRTKYNQLEALDPLRSVKFALFTFVVMLAIRGLAGMHPAPDAHPPAWPVSVGVALGVALVIAYLLPRFVGLFANSIVILSEKGVNNNTVGTGVKIRFWPWSEIASCCVWTESLNNDRYPVLSFCDANGIVLATLCCSEKVSLPQIERMLSAHRIPIRHEQPAAQQACRV